MVSNFPNRRYPSEQKRERYDSYNGRPYHHDREREIVAKKRWESFNRHIYRLWNVMPLQSQLPASNELRKSWLRRPRILRTRDVAGISRAPPSSHTNWILSRVQSKQGLRATTEIVRPTDCIFICVNTFSLIHSMRFLVWRVREDCLTSAKHLWRNSRVDCKANWNDKTNLVA